MHAKSAPVVPWIPLLLAALAGVASCAAGAPDSPLLPVRTQAVDANRDGHPEDLRVEVTLARVPADAPWWVLDYKLDPDAVSDPAVHEQLARYCRAVQLATDGQPVRAAVVTADGRVHPLI